MMKPEVLAIIPARGGSKGIPRKNIRILGRKPLIAYAVEVALNSEYVNRVIVTTDDEEISEIAHQCGAEVPFIRPSELAEDSTSDLPVCQHALSWLSAHENYTPDVMAWLRPTAPLRETQDVDTAIKLLIESDADCVRSVCLAKHHPYWMGRLEGNSLVPLIDGIDEKKYYQRQLLPTVYQYNGAVDAIWCKSIPEEGMLFSGNILGCIMPEERSIDLDTELDFKMAELLIQQTV